MAVGVGIVVISCITACRRAPEAEVVVTEGMSARTNGLSRNLATNGNDLSNFGYEPTEDEKAAIQEAILRYQLPLYFDAFRPRFISLIESGTAVDPSEELLNRLSDLSLPIKGVSEAVPRSYGGLLVFEEKASGLMGILYQIHELRMIEKDQARVRAGTYSWVIPRLSLTNMHYLLRKEDGKWFVDGDKTWPAEEGYTSHTWRIKLRSPP